MHLRVILPVTTESLVPKIHAEAAAWASPGTHVDVKRIAHGPSSIESEYDEVLAGPAILDEVDRAREDGVDGVFITCFADPAVHAAREIIDVPVVGGFEPAVQAALGLGDRVAVLTVLPNVVPGLWRRVRSHGLGGRVTQIRSVDTPVLSIDGDQELFGRMHAQARDLLDRDQTDVLVLGCTGMIGLARRLQDQLVAEGSFVPVIDPTGAAILALETSIRLGVRPSRTTYLRPPAKDRTRPAGS